MKTVKRLNCFCWQEDGCQWPSWILAIFVYISSEFHLIMVDSFQNWITKLDFTFVQVERCCVEMYVYFRQQAICPAVTSLRFLQHFGRTAFYSPMTIPVYSIWITWISRILQYTSSTLDITFATLPMCLDIVIWKFTSRFRQIHETHSSSQSLF